MSYGAPPPNAPGVTVEELDGLRARGVPLVDVREPHEYEAGHVPGAVLIPLGQVTARVGEITRDEPVYVICEMGGRSAKAAQWYRTQGIDARNVVGGMRAWVGAGKASITGSLAG